MARAYAAVVVACNGSSWLSGNVPSMDNLVHLRRMAHWLERVKNISDVTRVCLVAGYAAPALQRWASDCDEIVDVPMARLVFWKRRLHDHVWAEAAHADSRYLVRGDGRSTSLKFEAWLLTRYKGGVLVSDADVCLDDDPLPYMRHAHMRDEYFVASPENGYRSWTGLNTHLMFLRPSECARRVQDTYCVGIGMLRAHPPMRLERAHTAHQVRAPPPARQGRPRRLPALHQHRAGRAGDGLRARQPERAQAAAALPQQLPRPRVGWTLRRRASAEPRPRRAHHMT